jgi:hypothetical protein
MYTMDRRHLREHQRAGVSFLWECTMGLRETGRLGAILAGAAAAVPLFYACKLHASTVDFISHRHATKVTQFYWGLQMRWASGALISSIRAMLIGGS